MSTLFQHYPSQPSAAETQSAFVILCNAHDAASSFRQIYNDVRKARRARGMATDEEQDLLRAMLSFASAGLDAMTKQLIRDALPLVLMTEEGAIRMFKDFVERRLKQGEGVDTKIIADVIGEPDPRSRLIRIYIDELTSRSLQSAEEILKAGAAFDIKSSDVTPDINRLKEVFRVRNQIAHEMDVDLSLPNRNRRTRAQGVMIGFTNEVFSVASKLLASVDKKVSQFHVK